jgi:uncharacterized protein YegL
LDSSAGNGTTDDLELMFKVMEQDVLRFARHMETLILPLNKCTEKVFGDCLYGSYDGCASSLPTPSCPGGSDFASTACDASGTTCGAIYDFNATTLRIAPGSYDPLTLEPTTNFVKDAVCYSLQAQNYMINYTKQNMAFWAKYSVSPPSLYYGADNGVFRIYPGNPKSCPTNYNEFDPRLRPWYVAASTGPKDVVLILDTSGSMEAYNRMALMKDAAKYVINTLSVADYVSVVTFNTEASSLTNSLLQRVRTTDISTLLNKITNLTPGGSTNFYSGFKVAFDTLRKSIDQYELTAGCQRAIIFLTDGENNGSVQGDQLITYIKNEIGYYTTSGKRAPAIFTLSFGTNADEALPKRIACETNGIWSRISDGGNLAEAMTAYYKYFAFGLGDQVNRNFTAWVEPYQFARGVGLGTSVSAPVFDRSVSPPTLAGVVAADISLAAMEQALGEQGEAGINTIISRLVARSVAYCPKFNLTQCQYQSLRVDSSLESLCDGQCNNLTSLKMQTCTNLPYPTAVLNNKNMQSLPYERRACCYVDANVTTQGSFDVCISASASAKGSIPAIAIGVGVGVGVFVLLIVVLTVCFCCKKKVVNEPVYNPETHPVTEATLVPVPPPAVEATIVVEPSSATLSPPLKTYY